MEMDLKSTEFCYLAEPEKTKQPTASPNTIVVIAPTGGNQSKLGPVSELIKCPHCDRMMESRLEKRVTKQTHLFAFALCLTGLICLVPLPYCLKSCQNEDHFCSECNRFLGKAHT